MAIMPRDTIRSRFGPRALGALDRSQSGVVPFALTAVVHMLPVVVPGLLERAAPSRQPGGLDTDLPVPFLVTVPASTG